ncbi:hypothetical protein Bca52824_014965 [Brassica carinata]|uniref:Uncharacterized protein n=1 Tax=Brassica carinata TaxID=52824 RepID=A0A8X7W2F4_BRACI|nr:hypothetical protein Bca52824_014965 [Brassica carinata]
MSFISFDYCFLVEVTASNLEEDKLYLPVVASSSPGFNKQCQEMIVVNKEGNSWTETYLCSIWLEMGKLFHCCVYVRKGKSVLNY